MGTIYGYANGTNDRAHPGSEFFPQERFEKVEYHVEYNRLVDDVDSFDSRRYSILKT